MKITRCDNYRVEVTPETPWFIGDKTPRQIHERWRDACEEIAAQIRRHVDVDKRAVSVLWDQTPVCSFCGAEWTEGDSPHNGGCCDEDTKLIPPEPEEVSRV